MSTPAPETAGASPAPRRPWRCRRHPDRPAAARCPECGEAHCRECVVEHEGRILCAACLTRLTAASAAATPTGSRFRVGLSAAVGVLALILTLWLGLVLVREFLEPAATPAVQHFTP